MKISQTMPNLLLNGGMFRYMTVLSELDMTAPQLGIAYNFHSGQKTPNSLLKNYLDEGVITSDGEQALGLILENYYKEKWTRIIDVLKQEYEPLENYNKTSTITDKKTGQDTLSHGEQNITKTQGSQSNSATIGAQNNSATIGAQNNTSTIGAQSNSSSIGGVTVTDTIGQQSVTDVHKTVAFDETALTTTDEHDITNGAHTDTHGTTAQSNSETLGQRQDSQSLGQRQDSQSLGQRQDSQTIGQRQDSEKIEDYDDTTTYGSTNTHSETTTGNIGVTTSQQMAQSELDLRQYDVCEQIFNDIDKLIALGVYA